MSTSRPSTAATRAEHGRVLGACPAGIWVISGDDRTLLANEALVRLLGTSPSELLASSARRFFDPADVAVADELLRDPGASTDARTLRLRRVDGQLVRVVATGSPWMQGTHGGTVLALSPMTVSRNGMEQLRRRERQFREAERLGHLGSWEWEVQTGRLTFSDVAHKIVGIFGGHGPAGMVKS